MAGEVRIRPFFKREQRLNCIGQQLSNGDIITAAGRGDRLYVEAYRYVEDPREGRFDLVWECSKITRLYVIPGHLFIKDWDGEKYHPNSLTAEGLLSNGRRAIRVYRLNPNWDAGDKIGGVIRKLSEKETDKTLYIIRGVPGSGKSTFVSRAFPRDAVVCSMDNFCTIGGKYNFDPQLIMSSVQYVAEYMDEAMRAGVPKIVADNTHSRVIEYARWRRMAERHGYSVCVLVIPWDSASVDLYAQRNVHGDPSVIRRVIEAQMERWEMDVHDICLRGVWDILADRRTV